MWSYIPVKYQYVEPIELSIVFERPWASVATGCMARKSFFVNDGISYLHKRVGIYIRVGIPVLNFSLCLSSMGGSCPQAAPECRQPVVAAPYITSRPGQAALRRNVSLKFSGIWDVLPD